MPKKIQPTLKTLPVEGVKQDVESDAEDTKDVLKYCTEQSEHTEINPMNKIKKSNLKGSRII